MPFSYYSMWLYSLGCMHAQLLSHVWLCDPMDCSHPGSSVHGIFQARILEWLPIPTPGDLPNPGIEPRSPALQADSLPLSHQGSPFFCSISINTYKLRLIVGHIILVRDDTTQSSLQLYIHIHTSYSTISFPNSISYFVLNI